MAASDYADVTIDVVTTVERVEFSTPTSVKVAKDSLMTSILGAKMDLDAGISDTDYEAAMASS